MFSGVTGLPQVGKGAYISASTVVTSLDNLDNVRVDFSLPESSYQSVARQQAVQVATAAVQGEWFDGKVSEIDSRIDASTGSFGVRAILPNVDRKLRAGMFVQVRLQLGERQALLIPEEALIPRGVRTYVVAIAEGVATQHEVTTGVRTSGLVEIINGIEAGMQLVTRGHAGLKNGDEVTLQQSGQVAADIQVRDTSAGQQ